jgi:uncharacterized protein YkwD
MNEEARFMKFVVRRNRLMLTTQNMATKLTKLIAVALCASVALCARPTFSHSDDGITLGEAPRSEISAGFNGTLATPQVSRNADAVLDIGNRQSSLDFFLTQHGNFDSPNIGWTGNQAGCVAGVTSQEARDAIVRRINYFRAMAGAPSDINLSPDYNAKAQEAALMMSANQSLNHTPPNNWKCYTDNGAKAAGSSNLALGVSGAGTIDLYMKDPGASNFNVGHRRWILYPQTKTMGTGDVSRSGSYYPANSLWVFDLPNMWGARPATREAFVAWPPSGFVPYRVVYPRWSFSYPNANFDNAKVSMTSRGASVPLRIERTNNGYGENTIGWIPFGLSDGSDWPQPADDTPYEVSVSDVVIDGQARSFKYTVTIIDIVQKGNAPTAINLSTNAVDENKPNATLGALSAVDADAGDTHIFKLISGPGDTDNASFTINGNSLVAKTAFDFEKKNRLQIRVQATDSQGNSFVTNFAVLVNNVNEAPQLPTTVATVTGEQVNYTITATDPEGESSTISVVAVPSWLKCDVSGATATITGETKNAPDGTSVVQLRLQDSSGHAETVALTFVIAKHRVMIPMVAR